VADAIIPDTLETEVGGLWFIGQLSKIMILYLKNKLKQNVLHA
jgi:hypothetical protein